MARRQKTPHEKLRSDLLAILDYLQDDREWDDFTGHADIDGNKDLNDPEVAEEIKKSDHVYAVAQRVREALDDGRLYAYCDETPKPVTNGYDTTKSQDDLITRMFQDGGHPFTSEELYEECIRDALKWFGDNKIQSLVDNSAGGVIAYIHVDHAPRIARLLNASVCSQHHQL